MRFIGDIHGEFGAYLELIEGCDESIQVGDFGLGFGIDPPEFGPKHRFIRGNHDDKKVCQNHPNWIPDGTVEDDVMFCGGAWSIDWQRRTPGRDWWDDEELNDYEFETIQNTYSVARPRVMVTHDLPLKVKDTVILNKFNGMYPTRTGHWFQDMWDTHKPAYWICGHHHVPVIQKIEETTFIVLPINGYIDLNV